MNKEVNFEANGLRCRIEARTNLVDRIREDQFTYHYLIGSQETDHREFDVEVIQDDMIRDIVEIDYPKARFQGHISPRDVVVLGEYLLERARQEKLGFYNLSSACARSKEGAVVFFGGATNLGKTSYMLSLVQKCGFDFVSDEKTLLDLENKQVPGGAVSIPTRKRIIRERFLDGGEESPEYMDLVRNPGPVNVALMIYPHLDHGLEKPIFYQWKHLDFFWILTRELSNEIRGGIRLVDNFSHLLPSLDTSELTKKRVGLTRDFCSTVPCYYFQGSWDQIAEYTPKFIRGEEC
ncbi:hypothetical protein ACFL0X_00665 [Nanoarchaeota archaeon]